MKAIDRFYAKAETLCARCQKKPGTYQAGGQGDWLCFRCAKRRAGW